MFSIESILNYIHQGIKGCDERFVIVDDEHVLDTITGVKMHLYDDWLKMSRDGETFIMQNDFTPREQEIVWKIKQLITTPEKMKERVLEYPIKQKERRAKLSHYYENPEPITPKNPMVEEDTYEYTG